MSRISRSSKFKNENSLFSFITSSPGLYFSFFSFTAGEQSTSGEARQIHIDNLQRISNYAENMKDCRRALQLNYFGENFDAKECAARSDTICDNCKRVVSITLSKRKRSRSLYSEIVQSVTNYNGSLLFLTLFLIRRRMNLVRFWT